MLHSKMTTPRIPPTIHPDDEPLVTQLAALQKMHDQVFLSTLHLQGCAE